MSGSESPAIPDDTKKNKKSKFKPRKLEDLRQLTQDDIFAYIENLHELLRRSERKIKKYEKKYKILEKELDDSKQREVSNAPRPEGAKSEDALENAENTNEVDAEAAFNFVAEIRHAAEQAQSMNGFVYEPTSGLYYDQKSGYYYNAEYGLYYDGNTGCYYSYNQEKQIFEFHSQVQVQPSESATKATIEKKALVNYEYDEVEFDETGGVITDENILRQIRAQKNDLKKAKYNRKKHSKKRSKSKKRKRSRRSSQSSSGSDSTDAEQNNDSRSRGRHKIAAPDMEDGELSSRSSSSSGSESSKKRGSDVQVFKSCGRFQDIAKKYPPCLRIIVQETNLEKLKIGSLSLITFKGGSLGREGDHDVIIPDVNVSKYHLKFTYDTKAAIYQCIDLGSRNGTVLNGARMCVSKTESRPYHIVHGSTIQIAQTKLLCHIHEGNSTCGLCEPGLLIESTRETVTAASTNTPVVLTHKEQLKKLQKKYGLENEKFIDTKQTAGNYNDRAATRRTQIGSSTDNEKTQTASVTTEISSENKGFKMLSKLGWSKGEALGKMSANSGLLEPINVAANEGTKGLGCDDPTVRLDANMTMIDKKKIAKWKKAQERYQNADIFCGSDDDSS